MYRRRCVLLYYKRSGIQPYRLEYACPAHIVLFKNRSSAISRVDEDSVLSRQNPAMACWCQAKQVPESEIQEMSSHHIYERVHKLYRQEEHSLSPEEMNDPELTERDMDDRELAQYLKPNSNLYSTYV
ncbi:hypothetical protein BJV82DRAFT_575972 [Fennellomyces sp. T-0311]|nr:hypothetical protein BJV82DRAFT_575972 [Fennellomyces sp. T-0311]